MDKLEPIDRERLEALLGGHTQILDALHRRHRRLYGAGGLSILALTSMTPALLSWTLDLGAFQLSLASLMAFLSGLALVRRAARTEADRLRGRFEDHCLSTGVQAHELIRGARLVPTRWGFFNALWEGALPEDEARG